jgi:rRNA processing protein Gar1
VDLAGLAIYDTMEYISAPVSTVCIGAASSMAALLLTGGAAGKRFALPHSSVMVHQPLGGTHGQASDILIYATQIQRIRDQVNKIYRKHLNRAVGYDKYDLDAINIVMERDKYMTADEAKEYGIIDEILGNRADVAAAVKEKENQRAKESEREKEREKEMESEKEKEREKEREKEKEDGKAMDRKDAPATAPKEAGKEEGGGNDGHKQE